MGFYVWIDSQEEFDEARKLMDALKNKKVLFPEHHSSNNIFHSKKQYLLYINNNAQVYLFDSMSSKKFVRKDIYCVEDINILLMIGKYLARNYHR